MKTSLIIPCTPNHFNRFIERTLSSVRGGTEQPDEIIVSLSCANEVDLDYASKVKDEYGVIVLAHQGRMTHGPNRQAGSEIASGDVLIYQDADDIPHTQRIEIIKYFFRTHDIVHLNHFWIPESCDFTHYEKEDIVFTPSEDIFSFYFPNNSLSDCINMGGYGSLAGRTHGGPTAIRREVLQKVRWKDWRELEGMPTEDYCFCVETLWNFNKSIIIHAELNKYTNPDAEEMYRR